MMDSSGGEKNTRKKKEMKLIKKSNSRKKSTRVFMQKITCQKERSKENIMNETQSEEGFSELWRREDSLSSILKETIDKNSGTLEKVNKAPYSEFDIKKEENYLRRFSKKGLHFLKAQWKCC
jgi:hypothetical protein